jgi:type VI secretion system protein ImpH
MADESRTPEDPVALPTSSVGAGEGELRSAAALLDALARAPGQFDFFQALRRLDSLAGGGPRQPRFGAAWRPADESIRLGQEPDLTFAPSSLANLRAGDGEAPPRLAVNFFGLLGPNGPLPLHLTEYARDRLRNAADPTMSRFLDLFHHRMLLFFYRAWAAGQPTVSRDRPRADRFEHYIGALPGLALAAVRSKDSFPHTARLYYAGLLSSHSRNAEGLAAMVQDFFAMPARVAEFAGGWIDLPAAHRWRLGGRQKLGRLGLSTIVGARAWTSQQKFQLVLGPLTRAQFQRMLPGGPSLPKLVALVRSYIGDELVWDLRLVLAERIEEPLRLGMSRLGWTAWLGRAAAGQREDLVLDPLTEAAAAAA